DAGPHVDAGVHSDGGTHADGGVHTDGGMHTDGGAHADAGMHAPDGGALLGVYRGPAPYSANNVDSWETWIGRSVDLAEDFEATNSWDNLEGPGWELPSWEMWKHEK